MATEVKTRAHANDSRFTAEQCPCVIVSNDADPAQYAVVALADFPDDDAERRELWPWAFPPEPEPEKSELEKLIDVLVNKKQLLTAEDVKDVIVKGDVKAEAVRP